jgi:hypothetical protein
MSITKVTPPPKDLSSFLGRKWLESLNRQNEDLGTIIDLPFVLDVASALLPYSRALTVASNLTLTDGGAGGNLQISLNVGNANVWTADQSVPDEVYGVAWNGSTEVPTKNAVYDKIETVVATIPSAYTNEMAQDAVGAMIDSTLIYVDATPLLGINLNNANTWTARQIIQLTTEQQRIGYDGSNYFSITVGATGGVTFNAVGAGSAFSFSDKVSVNNPVNLKGYTVATLPTGVQGDFCYVTDATAPTYLATVVGGGAVVTPVFYDGTNWVAC